MNLINIGGSTKEGVHVPIWNGTWELPKAADNPPRKPLKTTTTMLTEYAAMAEIAAKLQKKAEQAYAT